MKINTFGEFYMWLKTYELDNLNTPIANFICCVNQYNSICSCKKNAKFQQSENCTQQYINIVQNVLPQYKEIIFSKIKEDNIEFFYNNKFNIGTLSR